MKLRGKTALITGGNSGIGLAIAREFSAHGANLVLFGRNENTLSDASSSMTSEVLTVCGDVRAISDLEEMTRRTQEHFGSIDIVVANAGGATLETFLEVTEESFDRQSEINFKGAFFTVQKSLPLMTQGGSIIIVSSSANCRAVPGMSVYGGAKAAVRSLGRTLAQELAPHNIRVNILTPGPVITPAYDRIGISEEQVKSFQDTQKSLIPLARIGQPQELAKAALFLASADASYMTGSELVVDGGMTQV